MTKTVISEYKNIPKLSPEAEKFVYSDINGIIPEHIKKELEEYVKAADVRDNASLEEMIRHFDKVFDHGPL